MTAADHSTAFCATLVGALADAGVTHAFISPGSRNTPMTLALVADERITDINVRDERSAGFMAVGIAKATGSPAIVLCTSGSAATHYYPAVVEADQSATPFIVMTSDRPERLRGTGAAQTMDQVNLFGTHVKRFIDVTAHHDATSTAAELLQHATGGVPGTVHLNLPFDEPLVPLHTVTPADATPYPRAETPKAEPLPSLDTFDRILFVASGRQSPGFGVELARVTGLLKAPALVDPQIAAAAGTVIDHGDLIAGTDHLDRLAPDVIVRLGPLPTSKPLWQWMERCGLPQIVIDNSRLSDPLDVDARHSVADPTQVLAATHPTERSDHSYLEDWLAADTVATASLATAMASIPYPNEPAITRQVAMSVRDGEALWLASSRPIRDVDAFAPSHAGRIPLSNRGVNGIDGNISSAIGAALSVPTTLLIGDIAALHDVSALAEAAELGVPLRVVVINNDGGGIFSFLPQAASPAVPVEVFEKHWGTPHGLSLATIATAFGVPSAHVATARELDDVLAGPPAGVELIEVHTDRAENVRHHRAIREAVAMALSAEEN